MDAFCSSNERHARLRDSIALLLASTEAVCEDQLESDVLMWALSGTGAEGPRAAEGAAIRLQLAEVLRLAPEQVRAERRGAWGEGC